MAGVAVGHSILLGGPGFPAATPSHVLLRMWRVSLPLSETSIDDLPCVDDIPLNAATADTHDLYRS